MVLNREITARITDLLVEHPQGLSITEIVKKIDINRNTAGRYLENLLVSGQVEMRHFGMAKIYALSNRIPQSAMLSISSDLVMQLDANLRIVFANEPFLKMLGVSTAELFGKNIEYTAAVTVFDDALENFIQNLRNGVSGKEWRNTLTLNNGEQIFSCHIYPIVFTDGRKGVSVLMEDVTEFQRNECALRESEDRYRKLVEISPDAVILHSDGKIIYVNPAGQKLIGAQNPEEMVGKPVLDFIDPKSRDTVSENIRKDLDGEKSPPMELEMLRLDGTSVTVEGRGVKTLIGGKSAVIVAIRDITARKRAEIAVRESEQKYRAIVENTIDAIYIHDFEGTIIDVNENACRMVGYERDELIGANLSKIDYGWSLPVNRDLEDLLKRSSIVFERENIHRNGAVIPVEVRVQIVNRENKGICHAFVRDITERKAKEDALHTSEERYRFLIGQSFDAIVIHKEGKIAVANEVALTLAGIKSPADLIGRSIYDFIHPDSKKIVEERIALLENTETLPRVREKFIRPDGKILNVEVMATRFIDKGIPAIQIVFREISDGPE